MYTKKKKKSKRVLDYYLSGQSWQKQNKMENMLSESSSI